MKSVFFASALLVLATIIAKSNAQTIPRTISVSGEGSVSAPPDMATINTGVITTAPTAEAALAANNQQFEQVLAVLAEQGINSTDIQTTSFNVNPQIQRGPNFENLGITGYQVVNQVRVVIRDLDSLGRILDALVTAGSNSVSGVVFGIGNDTELRNRARALAVADATSRAGVLAAAAGATVGDLIAISEQPIAPASQFLAASAFGGGAGSSVPVATGQLEIRAMVSLQFALVAA